MRTTFVLLAVLAIAGCSKAPAETAEPKAAEAAPVAVAAAPAPDTADILPALEGEKYDDARAELKRQGYEPVTFTCTATDALCNDEFDNVPQRYPEVVDCAPTGLRPCQFAWRKSEGDRYIRVNTTGEEVFTVSSVAPTSRAGIEGAWRARSTL